MKKRVSCIVEAAGCGDPVEIRVGTVIRERIIGEHVEMYVNFIDSFKNIPEDCLSYNDRILKSEGFLGIQGVNVFKSSRQAVEVARNICLAEKQRHSANMGVLVH